MAKQTQRFDAYAPSYHMLVRPTCTQEHPLFNRIASAALVAGILATTSVFGVCVNPSEVSSSPSAEITEQQ